MTEAELQREILHFYGARPDLRLWRQNTGAAMLGGRMVRYGVPGTPDILGLRLPHGQLLGIECKSLKGRQSQEQRAFQKMIESFGGIYILAFSLTDVQRVLG